MTEAKNIIRITEAEWEVINETWQRHPIAATDILQALSKRKRWTLATVRTLLTRLVDKGALAVAKEGRRFLYSPLVSRAECIRQESKSFIDRVFGGVPRSIILDLVRETEFSPEDIRELRQILKDKEK